MAKKNTAHRPSQSNMEYVRTKDGRRVKNTAYVPRANSGTNNFVSFIGSTLPQVTKPTLPETDYRHNVAESVRNSSSPAVQSWVKEFGNSTVSIDDMSVDERTRYASGAFAISKELGDNDDIDNVVSAVKKQPISAYGVSDNNISRNGGTLNTDTIEDLFVVLEFDLYYGAEEGLTTAYKTISDDYDDGQFSDIPLGAIMDMSPEQKKLEKEFTQWSEENGYLSADDYEITHENHEKRMTEYCAELAHDIHTSVDAWMKEKFNV